MEDEHGGDGPIPGSLSIKNEDRRMNLRGLSLAVAAATFGALSGSVAAQPLKISQVYGGGGTAAAIFRQDYIELFNAGAVPSNLSGMSIQYVSATGTTWTAREISGFVQPGSYFLIRMDDTTAGQGDVPVPFDCFVAPDVVMTATSFKVALVNGLEPLSGCPIGDPAVIDLVGFGTANCFEGVAVPALSTTTAGFRAADGCTDTDNNNIDFFISAPSPRFSGSTLNPCPVPPGSDLSVSATGPTGSLQIGQAGSYSVNVVNFGPDAGAGIALTVPIPSNATLIGSNPFGTLVGDVLTIPLTDLALGPARTPRSSSRPTQAPASTSPRPSPAPPPTASPATTPPPSPPPFTTAPTPRSSSAWTTPPWASTPWTSSPAPPSSSGPAASAPWPPTTPAAGSTTPPDPSSGPSPTTSPASPSWSPTSPAPPPP